MAEAYDVIVIGGGPGGYVAAIRAAQLGLKTAVVEREHLGGICLNWGCIPTKALLRSAEIFHYLQHPKDYGLTVEGKVGFDPAAVVKRSRGVSGQLATGVGFLLKKNKVDVIWGEAAIRKQGEVVVAAPKKKVMEPQNPPPKGTLGAGTYKATQILPVEDAEIAAAARKRFEKQGITILTSTKVTNVEKGANDVTVTIEADGKSWTLQAERLISAVGVVGNVEGIGLEALGVAMERGCIKIDGLGRTNVQGIYAIGDVAGPPMLAHKAEHEGTICIEAIAGGHPHPMDKAMIPGCTYCQPQIASVGLTEGKAKEAGLKVKIGRFPFAGNGKAIALGEPDGMVKTIFCAQTGKLLGAHMVGAEVTELIQGYVVAMNLETTEEELMGTVFPHPTLSEMMHESVLDAYGQVIHK